ncbi:hypothetical protein Nepgr_026438 [Nepenthes gracilis]|uniref:Uncharacterized protein n=1 Tax=Nepenthes gracilis TaxID=150966 RepID=A0AAD3T7U6_NEPGR|nr:hypothetical protein Nepgr_026438 [Nepenthes gracilis]
MSEPNNCRPPSGSQPPPHHHHRQPLAPLQKQKSWSPDANREEAWLRRKGRGNRRCKSLTDEDVDELKACIELGFGFDSPELDQRLSDTLPALGFYYAINKHYYDAVSKSSSVESDSSSSPISSPHTMFSPGDDPKIVKIRLRQWAQVVACSVRQSCC